MRAVRCVLVDRIYVRQHNDRPSVGRAVDVGVVMVVRVMIRFVRTPTIQIRDPESNSTTPVSEVWIRAGVDLGPKM